MNKIRSKRQKNRFLRHVIVFLVCFLVACVTWLSVMYTKQEIAPKDGARVQSELAQAFALCENG